MTKEIIIAESHSQQKPKQKIVLNLEGGSPWFAYIWIDDECYVLTKGSRIAHIKKVNRRYDARY